MHNVDFRNRFRRSASIFALLAAAPAAAWAQQPAQSPEAQSDDTQVAAAAQDVAPETQDGANVEQSIVVTGSRIARPELDFPNPITSITSAQIQQSGETNLVDFLIDSPALTGSTSSLDTAGTGAGFGSAGTNLLDLRNLGEDRTLVLVDGRRHVAGLPGSAAVDINTIPTDLVERVDILTGGTSAIYGADGVSGVVNFVLKRNFDGLVARGQLGISERGDGARKFGSITYGKNFAADRGNVALSYEFNQGGRVLLTDRAVGRPLTAFGLVQNPDDLDDDPTVPDRIPINDLRYADSSPEGAIDVDFDLVPDINGDGTPYDRGRVLPGSGGLTQGGDSTPQSSYSGDILPNNVQHIANLIGSFEFSPAARLFFEGKYVNTQVETIAQPSFDFYTYISPDNAFIPAGIAAIAPEGFLISRDNFDLGQRGYISDRETIRTVVGLDGELGANVRYELSYTYGQTEVESITPNARVSDRYFAALDAVRDPATGQITCRINLPGQTIVDPIDPTDYYERGYAGPPVTFQPGQCVPLNLIGLGNVTPEAVDFITEDAFSRAKLKQHVVSGYVSADSGSFFNLPGGPIAAVIGGEYRKEKSSSNPDEFAQQGFYADLSQISPVVGGFDVKEAFGEVNLPILKDLPFAEVLSVGGAVRVSDYSTTGTSTSWTVNGVYAPVRDVRFRGTYSQAVRAPNVGELFQPESGTFEFIDDPCDPVNIGNGTQFRQANCVAVLTGFGIDPDTFSPSSDPEASATILGRSQGNENLGVETAKTWTAGIVLRPSFVPGLSLTADWYDIRIEDAVNTPTAEEVVELCVDQPTLDNIFCGSVTRDPTTGFVVDYIVQPENVAGFETAGLDVNLTYTFAPADLGRFTLKLVGNYLDKLEFIPTPGADVDIDRGEAFAPKFSGTLDLTWTKDIYTVNYGLAWQDKTRRFELETLAGNPDIVAPRYLNYKERWEHDLQLRIAPSERYSFYVGVNNLTDEKPSFAATNTPLTALGRYFYAGASLSLDSIF